MVRQLRPGRIAVLGFRIAAALTAPLILQGCATGMPLWWYRWRAERSASPRDHQRLAEAYRKEAAKLREHAASYNQMAGRARDNPSWIDPREREAWIARCQHLSRKYTEEAQENEALAEEHEGHAQALEDLRQIGAENPGRSSDKREE